MAVAITAAWSAVAFSVGTGMKYHSAHRPTLINAPIPPHPMIHPTNQSQMNMIFTRPYSR